MWTALQGHSPPGRVGLKNNVLVENKLRDHMQVAQ
jgi:hypothetical protein